MATDKASTLEVFPNAVCERTATGAFEVYRNKGALFPIGRGSSPAKAWKVAAIWAREIAK